MKTEAVFWFVALLVALWFVSRVFGHEGFPDAVCGCDRSGVFARLGARHRARFRELRAMRFLLLAAS